MSVREADWLLIAEAIERILAAVRPLSVDVVPIVAAAGRTLAVDVESPIDQPPWANSAMDGFAVRSSDVEGASAAVPRVLRVLETVPAGGFATRSVGPGEAIGIMTGAPIPDGADGVIRIEHTRSRDGGMIEIFDDADAGRNVRERGEDLHRGDLVLRSGRIVRAGEIGVLATVGRAQIEVYRRGRVGILSTGNELVDLDDYERVLAGERIANSNSYALSAATVAVGAEPIRLGIARDDADSLAEHLKPALDLDALVTTAGASVGEHDLVKDALERIGMRTLFWRVKIRPGSPFSFGLIERAGRPALPVFGLPGNPVSAIVTFEILVKPALRRMQGRKSVHAPTIRVRAAHRIVSPAGLVRFLRVTLEHEPGSDVPAARLTGGQGSGILMSVAKADALLVVPLDRDSIEEGEAAVAVPLRSLDEAQSESGF
jgi:molybdopterin molybdotransferase